MGKKINRFLLLLFFIGLFLITSYLLIFAFINYTKYYKEETLPEVSPVGAHIGDISGRVLFISSYSPEFRTFNNQVSGIKSSFMGGHIELDIECMDTKKFDTPENLENFKGSLTYKLQNNEPYDVVIAADDSAALFVTENHDGLFEGIPIVFMGVNNLENALIMSQNPLVTGVVEAASIKETIELAYDFIPDAERVVALVDKTNSGQADLELYYNENNQVNGLEYTDLDLSDMSFSEFENKLSQLGSKDIVLLLSVYNDANNQVISFEQGLEIILKSCNQPVFHPYYHGIGDGVVGGMVISHYEQGATAGKMAMKILSGTNVSDLEIVLKSPNKIVVDREVMEKYAFDPRKLPKESIMINSDKSFLETFGVQLVVLALLMIIQMVIITILIITMNKRTKAEAELKKFKLISDRALIGTMITSPTGIIQYCNEYYASLHGYRIDELIGSHRKILQSEEQYEESLILERALMANKQVPTREMYHISKDGMLLILLQSCILIDDDKGEPLYIVVNSSDITRIKELEKENLLMEARMRDQQRLNSIGVLAGGVAHEINNPINGIMNYAQLLLDIYGDNGEVSEYSREIINESTRVANIVKSLLQFSRQGSQEFNICNFNDLINQTMALIKTIIIKEGIELTVNVPENFPEVRCKTQQIRQVLMNLLTNARDAIKDNTGEKKITLSAEMIEINFKKHARITISDNGSGIPEYVKNSVFEPFFTTKPRDQGTGLGLSISYGILKEHGGNLHFTTEEGVGTSFMMDIPLIKDS